MEFLLQVITSVSRPFDPLQVIYQNKFFANPFLELPLNIGTAKPSDSSYLANENISAILRSRTKMDILVFPPYNVNI